MTILSVAQFAIYCEAICGAQFVFDSNDQQQQNNKSGCTITGRYREITALPPGFICFTGDMGYISFDGVEHIELEDKTNCYYQRFSIVCCDPQGKITNKFRMLLTY